MHLEMELRREIKVMIASCNPMAQSHTLIEYSDLKDVIDDNLVSTAAKIGKGK